MNWQEAQELPLGHTWPKEDLIEHFVATGGGLALPGKNAGFAVVAGVRTIGSRGDPVYEVHILAEHESWDMKALLRQCRAMGRQYNIGRLDVGRAERIWDVPFDWYGDGKNTSALAVVDELNRQAAGPDSRRYYGPNTLCLQSTPLLDWEHPYPAMLSELKDYLRKDHKQLHLQGSTVEGYLGEIKPDEQADLEFGAFPAIEALMFVTQALRDEAAFIHEYPRGGDTDPYRNWRPGRGRR